MRTRKKENRSKIMKPESTHPATFFLVKPKEDLVGGTTAAKMSPPLGGRSGIADTGAPEEANTGASEEPNTRAMEELGTGAIEEPGVGASEELVPDDRLLQKDQDQSQNKKEGFNNKKTKKNSPTCNKGHIIILFLLALDQGHHSTS